MTTDSTTTSFSLISLSTSSSSSASSTAAATRLSFDSTSPPGPATSFSIMPHRSSYDSSYSALSLSLSRRPLSFRDFRLLRRIGSGDTDTVFLCSLADSSSPSSLSYYAMKVVDRDEAERKKKTDRVETERRVLRMVDHPFLPTLYAEFEVSSRFSCVMEYCEGGDLHVLRHRLPHRCFPLSSARYASKKHSSIVSWDTESRTSPSGGAVSFAVTLVSCVGSSEIGAAFNPVLRGLRRGWGEVTDLGGSSRQEA